MTVNIYFAVAMGFVLGIAAAVLLRIAKTKTAKELAGELFREGEAQRKLDMDKALESMKASFGNLSLEALSRSTEEFLKLAKSRLESQGALNNQELDSKKGLIDRELERMTSELENVSKLVKDLESDRIEKFAKLEGQIQVTYDQTSRLIKTADTLREALSHTKSRGQWGERMAEDVLRLAGFIENVNYLKQKAIEGAGSRPDFTFLLPRDLRLNMDVKFPLDNYLKFVESDSELEQAKFRSDFLRDVRCRIKEVTTREYIDPEQKTVDYVLLFIPNEQVYAFILEQDRSIFEDAIKSKVVFCSPVTFFAILAVVRQAIDNFTLERTSNEILSLLGAFKKQWDEFLKKLELLGKRISDAHDEYEALSTTRRRQLEKPLNKIEAIRTQRGLPQASLEDDASLVLTDETIKE